MTQDKDFKGYIHDVGGPTANFRAPACTKQLTKGVCKNRQCLFPTPCKNLVADHSDYISLLRKLRNIKGVKKYLSVPVSVLTIFYVIRKIIFWKNFVNIMSADS